MPMPILRRVQTGVSESRQQPANTDTEAWLQSRLFTLSIAIPNENYSIKAPVPELSYSAAATLGYKRARR